MTVFYKNYCDLCAKKGMSVSGVAAAIGLSNAAANGWKKGKQPSDTTLAKLAAYFGVSVSDLTEDKEKSPTPEGMELDAETMELREIWNTADQEEREALLAMAKMLKARRNK